MLSWHARIHIDYARERFRTVARATHEGPLRILQTLYPEGEEVAHTVLVHPPSGVVGGDVLEISARLREGAHAFVTTPGATRFYRTHDKPGVQRVQLRLEPGSRLEWLPLETLAYSGCRAENHLQMNLAPGAEMMGWDVLGLGLPAADQPFTSGTFLQHVELEGDWLERGVLGASDLRLMEGPLGLAGRRCLAMLYFACGSELQRERREEAIGLANNIIEAHAGVSAGVTAPSSRVVVVRVLAGVVEPAMQLLKAIHRAWRPALWSQPPVTSRLWSL